MPESASEMSDVRLEQIFVEAFRGFMASLSDEKREALNTPAGLAGVEADAAANLVKEYEDRGGRVPEVSGGAVPTWQRIAHVVVVDQLSQYYTWGAETHASLFDRLRESVSLALSDRAEHLQLATRVADIDVGQKAATAAFEAEQKVIHSELRNSGVTPPSAVHWFILRRRVVEAAFLYRPLFEAWAAHPGAKNMTVRGTGLPIYELANGEKVEGHRPIARSSHELRRMLQLLCGTGGIESKTWSMEQHELELSLPEDGSRLTAVDFIVTDGPFVTIRRHLKPVITLDEYATDNPRPLIDLVAKFVTGKFTFLLVGPTNSGKTTFLRALGSYFEPLESVVVAESVDELRYHKHPEVYGRGIHPLLARRPGPYGGGKSLTDCVITAQRMSPSRLVVGEIRGPEVQGLLTAAQMGHAVMSTVHGHDAVEGIGNVARFHEQYTSAKYENSLAQLCSVIDVIMTVGHERGQYRIEELGLVTRLTSGETGQPTPQVEMIYTAAGGFQKRTVAELSSAWNDRLAKLGIEHRLVPAPPVPQHAGSVGG